MASESITISRDGTQVATATADPQGHSVIVVPSTGWTAGAHTIGIVAQGGGRGQSPEVDIPKNILPDAIWQDLFDRADGAPANGWVAGHTLAIVSGALTLQGGAFGVSSNPGPVGGLPADYAVTVGIPHAMLSQAWWGIAARVSGGAGVELFTNGANSWLVLPSGTMAPLFGAGNPAGTVQLSGSLPASWAVNQDHTLSLEVIGTRARIYMDGVQYGADVTVPAGATGTSAAIVGNPQGVALTVLDVTVLDQVG